MTILTAKIEQNNDYINSKIDQNNDYINSKKNKTMTTLTQQK